MAGKLRGKKMTKQEEIREGMAKLEYESTDWLTVFHCPWDEAAYGARQLCYKWAERKIAYLHSRGVVVKVGEISDDLAETASDGDTRYAPKVGLSWERNVAVFKAFKEAGYVAVEPLIEGK